MQRLLQLKQREDFDDCLDEAAHILGFPELWPENQDDIIYPTSLKVARFSPRRCDWVLKWLLDKLKTSSAARFNEKSWILLNLLFIAVSKSDLARALIANDFLTILESTLQGEEELKKQSVSYHSQNDSGSPSRKRKRDSEEPDSSMQREVMWSTHGFQMSMLLHTNTALETLHSLMADARIESDKIAQGHLASVFRTNIPQAFSIMALCQKNLTLLDAKDIQITSIELEYPHWILDSSLQSVSSRVQLASTFSEQCLISSLNFQHHVSIATINKEKGDGNLVATLSERPYYAHPDGNDWTQSGEITQKIDQLFLKNFITPAQATFSQPSKPDSKTVSDIPDFLQELLKPLRSALTIGGGPKLESPQLTIPYLWRLVIQATPKKNARQRAHARPWLRAMFRALADCAGAAVTGPAVDKVEPESTHVIQGLLEICCQEQMSIGVDILENIVRRYSGMGAEEAHSISWMLIAEVLRLDANVFLPNYRTADDPDAFDKLLLKHISAVKWDDKFDPFTAPHKVASYGVKASSNKPLNLAVPREISTADLEETYGMSAKQFRTSVVVKLMQSYAYARKLPEFLLLWQRELTKNTNHIVTGSGGLSIWEDKLFSRHVGDQLAQSLNDQQFLEQLSRFGQSFENIDEAQNLLYLFTELRKDATGTDAAANVILLDALLGGIENDSTIELARDTILTIYNKLLVISSEPSIDKLSIMPRIWSILSRIRNLLLPFDTNLSERNLSLSAVISPCFNAAMATICERKSLIMPPGLDKRDQALNFALSTSLPLHLKQQVPDYIRGGFAQVLEAVTPAVNSDEATPQDSPYLFEIQAALRLSHRVWFFEWVQYSE